MTKGAVSHLLKALPVQIQHMTTTPVSSPQAGPRGGAFVRVRGVLELRGHVVLGLVGQAQGQDEHLVSDGESRWGAECERAARGKREEEKGRVQIAGDANERH